MQVILLQRVPKLGQMGEVVTVKDGYGRNYLLPQGKALRANAGNIKSFEVKKVQLEAVNLETRKEAEAVAATLEGQSALPKDLPKQSRPQSATCRSSPWRSGSELP